MRSSLFFAFAGLAMLAPATPVTPPHPHVNDLPKYRTIKARQAADSRPCAQVSQALYGNSSIQVSTNVSAKVAYECITSIPFNATSAKLLVASLPPFIKWQSTLTTLANPPEEYVQKVQPPVDILKGLDDITADIEAGKYANEYEFGWALYTLIQSAHDGHFTYIPDVIGNIFTWGRTVPLVSVSEDGTKLPSVFAFHDVLGTQFKNISYTPSPITEIDGQDVYEYLEGLSQRGSLQDRDALYNNIFYNLAQVSLGSSGSGTGLFTGGGRGRWVYPGPTTTFTFANGSSSTIENYARVQANFRGIKSGEELADRYLYYASAGVQSTSNTISPVARAAAPGYPVPAVPGPANLINCFFVDTPGYEDVVVLQVPNFVGSETAEIAFQKTTKECIPKALAAGKTKLIIDVQANGGGTILQGYDMFKQLFPSIEPYGANRFRATEAADLIGQSFSAFASQTPRTPSVNSSVRSIQSSYFDYHSDTTVDGKPFTSWQEKFGPVEVNGDNYTTLSRWNLSDVHISFNSGGINITGYGPLANASATQPFKAENIVLLTDGYCASTCTIFSELLTKQAGVKTIALGGRSNSRPIQAIGGVKGVNNYQWSYIRNLASQAITLASDELEAQPNISLLRTDYTQNRVPFERVASGAGVNVRDGLLFNDTSGIALQFIYEEADCRLYYTPEMTVDATAMWTAAADAAWGKNAKCVGSSGYGKREADQVTTKLSKRRVEIASEVAVKKFQVFEESFALETECRLEGDGFMHP